MIFYSLFLIFFLPFSFIVNAMDITKTNHTIGYTETKKAMAASLAALNYEIAKNLLEVMKNNKIQTAKSLFHELVNRHALISVLTDANQRSFIRIALDNEQFDLVNFMWNVYYKHHTEELANKASDGKSVLYILRNSKKSNFSQLNSSILTHAYQSFAVASSSNSSDIDENELLEAIESSDFKKIDLIIEDHPDVDIISQVLLHAVKANLFEVVEFIVKKNVNLEIRDLDGLTPLMISAKLDDVVSLHYLIEGNATLDALDNRGYTPLFYAVRENNLRSVVYLISKGADKARRFDNGTTVTHVSSFLGHSLVVESLIDANVSLEDKDDSGATPLLSAIKGGNISTILCLMSAGADVNVKDNVGKGVFTLAVESNNPDVLQSIINSGKINFHEALQDPMLEVVKQGKNERVIRILDDVAHDLRRLRNENIFSIGKFVVLGVLIIGGGVLVIKFLPLALPYIREFITTLNSQLISSNLIATISSNSDTSANIVINSIAPVTSATNIKSSVNVLKLILKGAGFK